ncbi:phytoene/squalene synthase family protein [soil metagenome]
MSLQATGSGLAASTADESAAIIAAGSQSFAAASRLLPRDIRQRAQMLYAWCRWCDDVMDGQELGHGALVLTSAERADRLAELRERTQAALASPAPAQGLPFRALQLAAAGGGEGAALRIAPRWTVEHLEGFAMDVEPRPFADLDALLLYCWRVAGVVGVMMALVMDVAADDLATLRRAQDLGLAFQLTNIARDVCEDARNGRVYLPVDWLAEVGLGPEPEGLLKPESAPAVADVVRRLVEAAEPYYRSSGAGLPVLSLSCAWGIATARGVYREIGREVARGGVETLARRVSTSGTQKAVLALTALGPALGSRLPLRPEPRPDLWTAI